MGEEAGASLKLQVYLLFCNKLCTSRKYMEVCMALRKAIFVSGGDCNVWYLHSALTNLLTKRGSMAGEALQEAGRT